VSERDLQLKLKTARWFWAMGSGVVLRVRLTTYAAAKPTSGRRRSTSLTDLADLDVLGIEVGSDYTPRFRAAECKSGKAGTKELFWLHGVLHYFGGGDGYLVLQHDDARTPGLRELASRLGLGVITFNDFAALESAYPIDRAAEVIFSPATTERADTMLNHPAKAIERLTDYALRFSWQLPQHRNLQQTVGYLRSASEALRPEQREHVLLFGEVVLRYLLALYALAGAILRRGLPHSRSAALAYLHGGELGLHEVQLRVRAVQRLQQHLEGDHRGELASAFSETPPYFDAILDVVERMLRRPSLGTAALRQLIVALRGVLVAEQHMEDLMPTADPLAAKLVNDVAAFLTRAAELDRSLREHLSTALEVEATPRQVEAGSAASMRNDPADAPRAEKPSAGSNHDAVEAHGGFIDRQSRLELDESATHDVG
jgi:hypothetical protein